MNIDFSDKQGKELEVYNERKVASLIQRMPMTKWGGASKNLITFKNQLFKLNFDIASEDRSIVY